MTGARFGTTGAGARTFPEANDPATAGAEVPGTLPIDPVPTIALAAVSVSEGPNAESRDSATLEIAVGDGRATGVALGAAAAAA